MDPYQQHDQSIASDILEARSKIAIGGVVTAIARTYETYLYGLSLVTSLRYLGQKAPPLLSYNFRTMLSISRRDPRVPHPIHR